MVDDTLECSWQFDDVRVSEISHALYLLLNVFNKVGLFGKLFFVDALHRIDLIIRTFEFYLLGWKHIWKGTFTQFL